MGQFLRNDALFAFEDLVCDLGGEPEALLAAVGLSLQAIQQSGGHIPRPAFSALLELAARQLDAPDFGLLLGQRQTIHVIGPLALAIEFAETLADMLLLGERYIHLHDPTLHVSLRTLPELDCCLWSYAYHGRGATAQARAQDLELVMAVAAATIGRLAGPAWQPREIRFAHQALGDACHYARYFDCPLRFGEPVSGIVMTQSHLALPLQRRDAGRAALAREYLFSRYGNGSLSLSRQIEALIRPLLEAGQCEHSYVADLFAMDPRTLRRALSREGTSFKELKDLQRKHWALELLRQGLPPSHVAGILGYEHDSTFTRSCLRWYGQPPSSLRLKPVR